jgi:hypothetical protein
MEPHPDADILPLLEGEPFDSWSPSTKAPSGPESGIIAFSGSADPNKPMSSVPLPAATTSV